MRFVFFVLIWNLGIRPVSSPFSYSCTKFPKDAENQLEAASGAVSALRQPYGTAFMVRAFVRLSVLWLFFITRSRFPFLRWLLIHLRP